ncbi:hypothetical protein GF324_08510, partial [bacterium]|nr:hypothetical protein [bacterium]
MRIKAILVVGLVLLKLSCSYGDMIRIPTDYQEILEAVQYTDPGDTILLEIGEHQVGESISIPHALTIAGEYVLTHDTTDISSTRIISSEPQWWSIFTIEDLYPDTVRFTGFSMTAQTEDYGACIEAENSNLAVYHCIFRECQGFQGGVMELHDSYIGMYNTVFIGNSAINAYSCIMALGSSGT